MSDLISKQRAIEAIDRFIPADPMMSDYTQGISVGLAIATRCIEEFSQENDDSSQGLVKDLISRKEMLRTYQEICMNIACSECSFYFGDVLTGDCLFEKWIHSLPSAEPKTPSNGSITCVKSEKMHVRTTDDCISRQEAKDAIDMALDHIDHVPPWVYDNLLNALNEVPSAEKAQLSGEDATKDATSGLIRRQDAIDAVNFGITIAKAINKETGDVIELFGKENEELRKAIKRIKDLPSAQPEVLACGEGELIAQPEIVRCKDCKHKGTKNCVANAWTTIFGVMVKDDFYCGLAERRTDG